VNIEGFLTADEAADLLGIERRSIYTYVRRMPEFPQPTKVGRTLLFEQQALLKWRDGHPARQRQRRGSQ
jgi:prophage regulatory protein